jgi:hypothetical protein
MSKYQMFRGGCQQSAAKAEMNEVFKSGKSEVLNLA